MTIRPATETTPRAAQNRALLVVRFVLGLAFLIPALFVWVIGFVGPMMSTILASTYKNPLLGPAQWVGMANYAHWFEDGGLAQSLRFTLEMILVRLLTVAILPPLLALAVAPFGPKIRMAVRLVFTVPLAMFAPIAFGMAWLVALNPTNGVLRGLGLSLGDPARGVGTFLLVDALGTLGLACGVGLIVGLAALRDPAHPKRTLLVGWLVGLLATVALSLQSFTSSFVLTGGGPANLTTTLGLFQYRQTFVTLQAGLGAATATIMLAALMLIGLLVVLMIVFTGLRLELAPRTNGSGLRTRRAIPFLVVVLLLSLFLGSLGLLPSVLAGLSSLGPANALGTVTERVPLEVVLVNTWVPPLVPLLTQLPLVYLAALGIGALRPLGRWSEILLLPFGLWLFVGVGPFSMVIYQGLRSMKLLDTVVGLTPPMPLSMPALFVLTLFFKGQLPHWRAARGAGESSLRAFFTQLVGPSLPLAVLLAFAALLIATQELLWPLIVAVKPEHWPATLLLFHLRDELLRTGALGSAAVALGLVAFGLGLVVFGAMQLLYLDRLTLRTGDVQQ